MLKRFINWLNSLLRRTMQYEVKNQLGEVVGVLTVPSPLPAGSYGFTVAEGTDPNGGGGPGDPD